MKRKLERIGTKLGVAALALSLLAMPASATLIGDQINITETLVFGSTTRTIQDLGVTVDGSVELTFADDFVSDVGPSTLGGYFDVDVDGANDEIIITSADQGQWFYDVMTFEFTDLDWLGTPGSIANVSVLSDNVGDLFPDPFDITTLSWTADSILLELTGTDGRGVISPGEQIVLGLTTRHDPIPEPATLSLLGLGLAGLVYRGRKQRA